MLEIVSREENQVRVTPVLRCDLSSTSHNRERLFDIEFVQKLTGGTLKHHTDAWTGRDRTSLETPFADVRYDPYRNPTSGEWVYHLHTTIAGFSLTALCAYLAAQTRQEEIKPGRTHPHLSITPYLTLQRPENPDADVPPRIADAVQYPGVLRKMHGLVVSSLQQGESRLLTEDRTWQLPEVMTAQERVLNELYTEEVESDELKEKRLKKISDVMIQLYGGTPKEVGQLWERIVSQRPKDAAMNMSQELVARHPLKPEGSSRLRAVK